MSPPEDHIRTGGRRVGVATINRDGFSGGTGKASFRAERSYCVEWIGSWIAVFVPLYSDTDSPEKSGHD